MENTIAVFKALSDKNRFRILKMLEVKPLCVCEIKSVLGLANSTTSKHLSILKDADLIFEEKESKWVNYYLNSKTVSALPRQMLMLMIQLGNDDEVIQADRCQLSQTDRYVLSEK